MALLHDKIPQKTDRVLEDVVRWYNGGVLLTRSVLTNNIFHRSKICLRVRQCGISQTILIYLASGCQM